MHKELIKHIYHISGKYGGEKIDLVTNHLKISGTLCKCKDRDKSDHILTLMDADMYLLNDMCKCGDGNCNCSAAKICHSDWLNVNVKKVVAFNVK